MSKQRNSPDSEPPAQAQRAPKPEPWLERALDPAVMAEILKLAGINPAAQQRSGPSVADHRPGTSSSDAIPPRNGDTAHSHGQGQQRRLVQPEARTPQDARHHPDRNGGIRLRRDWAAPGQGDGAGTASGNATLNYETTHQHG